MDIEVTISGVQTCRYQRFVSHLQYFYLMRTILVYCWSSLFSVSFNSFFTLHFYPSLTLTNPIFSSNRNKHQITLKPKTQNVSFFFFHSIQRLYRVRPLRSVAARGPASCDRPHRAWPRIKTCLVPFWSRAASARPQQLQSLNVH